MKNKLDDLLNQEPIEEESEAEAPVKKNPVAHAYITKSALKKAYTYARLACDIMEESVECYGYLITPKDAKDRTARDLYLAPNQEVTSADVRIQGEDVIESGRAIDKMGYKVLGWWHSHGLNFSTFHSGTDDENMMKVLNSIAPTNFVTAYKQIPLMSGRIGARRRGKNVEIYDLNLPNKKVTLNLDSKEFNAKELSIVKGILANMPIRIGFAYSIVVNANSDKPYCEVATREYCELGYGEENSIKSKLVVVNRDELNIDEKKIINDIKEKIKKPQIVIPSITRIGTKFNKFIGLYGDYEPSDVKLSIEEAEEPTPEDDPTKK